MSGTSQLVLYTPGHSLYTDSLITYGIVYPTILKLKESSDPAEAMKVTGTGLNYVITVNGIDEQGIAEAIASFVSENSRSFEKELEVTPKSEAKTRVDGRIGLFSEKDVSEFTKALKNKSGIRKYLESLASPGHSENEGKIVDGRRAGSKLKLPLMPTSGKYLTQDLTLSNRYADNRYYSVCEYCSAFTALGLYCGAIVARLKEGPPKFREWALVIFLGFEGEVTGGTLDYTLQLVRSEAELLASMPTDKGKQKDTQKNMQREPLSLKLGRAADALPLRTLMQATVCLFADSAIRGMSESVASWKSLSVKFDATRAMSGNLQVRGYDEIILNPVINALAALMQSSAIGWLRERVQWLLEAAGRNTSESGDAVTALENLFTFFQTRRLLDLYSFVRSYEHFARKREESTDHEFYPGLSLKLCRELAKLSTKV